MPTRTRVLVMGDLLPAGVALGLVYVVFALAIFVVCKARPAEQRRSRNPNPNRVKRGW